MYVTPAVGSVAVLKPGANLVAVFMRRALTSSGRRIIYLLVDRLGYSVLRISLLQVSTPITQGDDAVSGRHKSGLTMWSIEGGPLEESLAMSSSVLLSVLFVFIAPTVILSSARWNTPLRRSG